MSEPEDNPLQELVGEDELDRELLLSILNPYLRFDDKGHIVYKPIFGSLPSKDKILVFLLARKALSDLGLETEEAVSPSTIADEISANGNTVRSSLSRLKSQGLVKKGSKSTVLVNSSSSGSCYQVPNSVLEEVKNRLDE